MGEAAAEAGKNYDDSDSVYGKTLPTEDTVINRKDDMDKHASEYTDGQTKELWNVYESVSQFELSGTLFFGTDLTSIYKGQANVIFENSKSGELRVADYDLSLTLKAGLEFNLIASLSHTTYSRLVKKSEHTDEFFQSFEDNFASVGKSFNYG